MEVGNRYQSQKMILMNILSRLPVKSLLRFKCVSKTWYQLISSSVPGSVKHEHHLRMHQTRYLVVYNDRSTKNFDEYRFGGNPEATIQFSVTDLLEEKVHNRFELQLHRDRDGPPSVLVCHGLVCLLNFKHGYVLNPSTREIVKLPDFFDKVWPKSTIAFGYLPNQNEYKIVAWFKVVSSGSSIPEVGCRILTLTDGVNVNSGTWKVIANRPGLPLDSEIGSLCVNGVIYWLSRSRWARVQIEQPKWDDTNENVSCALFSIDLGKEEYQLMPCPNFKLAVNLAEIEGCLGVGEFLDEYQSIMNLWKFKNNVWEIKCRIERPHELSRRRLKLIAGISDEELICMTNSYCSLGLVYYNIRSGIYRRVRPEIPARAFEVPFLCYDTLFCLGGK